MTDQQTDSAKLHHQVQALRSEIERAFIGQANVVDDIVVALLTAGHVLLEGVPGLGKTLLVKSMSKAIGGSFHVSSSRRI